MHKYLYPLYSFDILYHEVYDVYHIIPLNVVKNQLTKLLDLEMINRSEFDHHVKSFVSRCCPMGDSQLILGFLFFKVEVAVLLRCCFSS